MKSGKSVGFSSPTTINQLRKDDAPAFCAAHVFGERRKRERVGELGEVLDGNKLMLGAKPGSSFKSKRKIRVMVLFVSLSTLSGVTECEPFIEEKERGQNGKNITDDGFVVFNDSPWSLFISVLFVENGCR